MLRQQAEAYDAITIYADLAQALNMTIYTIERDSKNLLAQSTSLITRGAAKQTA